MPPAASILHLPSTRDRPHPRPHRLRRLRI